MDTIENNEIKKKSNKYTKNILISLLCLCILIGVFFATKQFKVSYKKNNIEKQNELQILQNTLEHNETIIRKLQNDNIALQNTTTSLNEKIELLQTELYSLKNYVYKLEQQNPVNSEKNLQIMILLNKIQKLYYSNKNFVEEMKQLKILTKNRTNLSNLVSKLDEFKFSNSDVKNILNIFKNEYKTNLLIEKNNKKKNIFKDILTNNIKIRKINTDVNNTNDKNVIIAQIENAIFANNFTNVVDLIVKNKYQDSIFKDTCKIAERILVFDNIMEELMSLVLGDNV